MRSDRLAHKLGSLIRALHRSVSPSKRHCVYQNPDIKDRDSIKIYGLLSSF
jgi:hypothetical protein